MDRRQRVEKASSLHRLFAEVEPVEADERPPVAVPEAPNDDTGVGPAPRKTVALSV